MNSKKRTLALHPGSAIVLLACLIQVMVTPLTVLAQWQSETTALTTSSTPLTKPVGKTTNATVVKKRSTHLKRRKGKIARKSHAKTTTVIKNKSGLSGGVAKTHKHHIGRYHASHKTSSTQQARSDKLNAFLKNPPEMKKTPYFNHPGLDVPSSPAL